MSEFRCPKCGAILTVVAKIEEPKKTHSLEDVKMLFPYDLKELLSFEESEDHIIVRPRKFLGAEYFAKIARIVKSSGGEYISAGKDSHFRITAKTE